MSEDLREARVVRMHLGLALDVVLGDKLRN
jgi:hypothetical protein